MNYAGSIDDFTLPLLAWLWFNQPDLLLNPDKNQQIKFTTLINNDDTADLMFELPYVSGYWCSWMKTACRTPSICRSRARVLAPRRRLGAGI
ncbi:MAG: phage tail protein [Enterobacteriaceae bacterium]